MGSLKKQEFQKNICFIEYTKAFVCVDHNSLEILKEMGIPDHLTYFLSNLYAGREAIVRTGYGKTELFQIQERKYVMKGVPRGCILSPCLFNLYSEYIVLYAGLDEAQAGIKTAGRNINNIDILYCYFIFYSGIISVGRLHTISKKRYNYLAFKK